VARYAEVPWFLPMFAGMGVRPFGGDTSWKVLSRSLSRIVLDDWSDMSGDLVVWMNFGVVPGRIMLTATRMRLRNAEAAFVYDVDVGKEPVSKWKEVDE